jgi:hypothetical protein
MNKTLLTLLGLLTLGTFAFSSEKDVKRENKKYILNKIENERIFNRDEYKDYEIAYYINKDRKCRTCIYDFDQNGKKDAWVYFKYPGDEYQDASVVFVDENEDDHVFVYVASNRYSQSCLETKKPYREYLADLNPDLREMPLKPIKGIALKPIKPITKTF